MTPITTVTVRAANSHQPIPSTVASKLRGTSSTQGAACRGLTPALISTQVNSRNTPSRRPMRKGRRLTGITCQSRRSSAIKMMPISRG
ncbi:hypothetical protein D3C79_630620 [compost metagenome]